MSPRARKIITALFLTGFVLTAPIVILNTIGYRYNWTKGRMEKTGILKLDSRPTGARIYVNGDLKPRTTPASLFRLLPEDYEVRLEKTGYYSWTKTLRVASSQTTFTDNVVLMKVAAPALLEAGDMEDGAFAPDGRSAAVLRRGRDWTELFIYDRQTSDMTLLARFSRDKYLRTELDWSPDGGTLLLQAALPDGGHELIAYSLTAAGEVRSVPLHQDLPPSVRFAARWSSDGARVTAVTDRGVFSLDPRSGAATTLIESPRVQDAAAVGRDLYLVETESDSAELEKAAADQPGDAAVVGSLPAGSYAFAAADAGHLILAGADGRSLLVETGTGRLVDTFDAGHARWERPGGGGRLLLWNDFEIYVYDPATGQRQLITRLGSPLAGCLWHPDGRNVIYATAAGVAAIELDDRDRRNVFALARSTDNAALFLDADARSLLFLGTVSGRRGIYRKDI